MLTGYDVEMGTRDSSANEWPSGCVGAYLEAWQLFELAVRTKRVKGGF